MSELKTSQSKFPHAWKAGNLPPGVRTSRPSAPLFSALTETAHSLQKKLSDGSLKSVDLVEEYVWRTEEYNPYLKAIFEYAPSAMKRAQELDALRASGKVLGPFHGIPIVVKDNIATGPELGMGTTAGTPALYSSEPRQDATVITKLHAAGAIILGKGTLSELGFHKGSGLMCGFSSIAGQAQSAYVKGGVDLKDAIAGHSTPAGSSAGPAIAISAGLAAIGVGTDTEGSLTSPAIRAALYSLRPTIGIVPTDGVVPLSHSFDTVGPLAKDVTDLADLLTVLVDPTKTEVPSGGYAAALSCSWKDIKVGMLKPIEWQYPDFLIRVDEKALEQIDNETTAAYEKIKSLAGLAQDNVELRHFSNFGMESGHSIFGTFDADFEGDINAYLGGLTKSKVRTLQEMVDWNLAHPEEALPAEYPTQDALTRSLATKLSPEEYEKLRSHYREVGLSFHEMLSKYDIDIIIGPGDSFFTQYGAANGSPVAAIPLSTLEFNGRPFGLTAIAAPHQEAKLLKFMKLMESTFPPRPLPKAFLEEAKL